MIARTFIDGSVFGTTLPSSVSYPATTVAGQLALLFIFNKYPPSVPSTPSGFTTPAGNQASGGSGGSGIDQGQVTTSVFMRELDGTEGGDSTIITVTSANVYGAVLVIYAKTADEWDVDVVSVAQNTAGATWTATFATDPGIQAGDMVVVCSGVNFDTGGGTRADELVTSTGVTFGAVTELADGGSALGDDIGRFMSEHPAITGTSSAAPVYTADCSTVTANAPAGSTVLVRLRELTDDPDPEPEPEPPTAVTAARRVAMGSASLRKISKLSPIRTGDAVQDRAQDAVVNKLNQLLEHPLVQAVPLKVALEPGLNKVSHGARQRVREFIVANVDKDGAVVTSRQSTNPHQDLSLWVWLESEVAANATIILLPGL